MGSTLKEAIDDTDDLSERVELLTKLVDGVAYAHGQATLIRLPRAEFARIHHQYNGGKGVAYLGQPPT